MDRSSGRRATVAKGGNRPDAQMRSHACRRFHRTRGREPTRGGTVIPPPTPPTRIKPPRLVRAS
eukprot:4894308-Prymnesium_polylepis.1